MLPATLARSGARRPEQHLTLLLTLQLPGNARQRRHKTHVYQFPALEAAVGADHADQGLDAMRRTDRRDQDSARLEPQGQGVGNLLHRRGDHDAVEIADTGRDVETVAQHHLDIAASELFKPQPGVVGQSPETFDRQYLTAKPRQDRRLVTGAGTD